MLQQSDCENLNVRSESLESNTRTYLRAGIAGLGKTGLGRYEQRLAKHLEARTSAAMRTKLTIVFSTLK